MADFPDSIFSPRVVENLPGLLYEPTDLKTGFAEDINLPNAEIVAIETELGASPKGDYSTVKARLDAQQKVISFQKYSGNKNLNTGGYVTIYVVVIPSLQAQKFYRMRVLFTLLNNSGALRTYTGKIKFGTAERTINLGNINYNATNRTVIEIEAYIQVFDDTDGSINLKVVRSNPGAAGAELPVGQLSNTWAGFNVPYGSDVAFYFQMLSSATNNTQQISGEYFELQEVHVI